MMTTSHFNCEFAHDHYLSRNGIVLVSGSRSIGHCPSFAAHVCKIAKDRRWDIMVGDARGVDHCVAKMARDQGIVVFTVYVYEIGNRSVVFPNHCLVDYSIAIHCGSVPPKQAFAIRDKQMVQMVASFSKRGFLALWDGKSSGTRLTAGVAKAHGIPGIIYININNGVFIVHDRWENGGQQRN